MAEIRWKTSSRKHIEISSSIKSFFQQNAQNQIHPHILSNTLKTFTTPAIKYILESMFHQEKVKEQQISFI
jgi:2-hydroxy-3-keto-5-methylthiopentenyl-1-phosphate phosphatase